MVPFSLALELTPEKTLSHHINTKNFGILTSPRDILLVHVSQEDDRLRIFKIPTTTACSNAQYNFLGIKEKGEEFSLAIDRKYCNGRSNAIISEVGFMV